MIYCSEAADQFVPALSSLWPVGDWWQVVNGTVIPSHSNEYQTNMISIGNIYIYILYFEENIWN